MFGVLGIPAPGCGPEDPFRDRAARVKAVAEGHGGRVLERDGCTMCFEIPADTVSGVVPLLGTGGHAPIYQGNRFEPGSPRGISWSAFAIDLRPADAAKPAVGSA